MIAEPAATTVVEAPTSTPPTEVGARGWRRRRPGAPTRLDRAATKPPFDSVSIVRMLLAVGLGAMAAMSLGGAVLMLLVWQQTSSGFVAPDEIERVWQLFDVLQANEVVIGLLCVPCAATWMALATWNVRRATCQRRNPIGPALIFVLVPVVVFELGARVVVPADEWWVALMGVGLQGAALGVAMVTFEYVAHTADAPRRPMRAATLLIFVVVLHVQFLGGVATIGPDDVVTGEEWGPLAAYLAMLSLLQAMAALALNEAFRSVEESTLHRHGLRKAFGSALAMVGSLRSTDRT